MKKHNISQFIRSKSFFVVLFVAVLAIAGVTLVGLRLKGESNNNKNLVDLNTPIDVTQNEQTDVVEDSKDAANTNNAAEEKTSVADYTNDELLEFDVANVTEDTTDEVAQDSTIGLENEQVAVVENQNEVANTEEIEEPAVSVMQPKVTADQLRFSSDSVLTWPVKGNVIKAFNVDNLVSFPTLNEWKTNPAIIISTEVGTNVVAATKGIVSQVTEAEETGTTVTLTIGDGYEIVYGQLKDVDCKVGDVISEGTVIGKVAEPTMYYSVEGSNLYLQLLCNQEPVNPMLFLAGE